MMIRLRPIFSLLLAFVVCCASSQAKVCELSCGLEAQGAACHLAAASRQARMQEMPHGHCAPAMHVVRNVGNDAGFSGLHPSACGHAFSLAVENVVAAKSRLVSLQTALFQRSSNQIAIPHFTAQAERHPPPLLFAANPLLIALRV